MILTQEIKGGCWGDQNGGFWRSEVNDHEEIEMCNKYGIMYIYTQRRSQKEISQERDFGEHRTVDFGYILEVNDQERRKKLSLIPINKDERVKVFCW